MIYIFKKVKTSFLLSVMIFPFSKTIPAMHLSQLLDIISILPEKELPREKTPSFLFTRFF